MTETQKKYGTDLFAKPLFPPLGKYDVALIKFSAGIDAFRLAFQRL